jgi:serine/threonine protein phosphatase 1
MPALFPAWINSLFMNYFIIGDIHGCYYTFCELLQQWDREAEMLICVGDLIDRGNYSAETVAACMQLQEAYPHTVFLKGNHEAEMITHMSSGYNDNWMRQGGAKTLENIAANGADPQAIARWFRSNPLKFETENLIVTHAGISATADPYDEDNSDGVLWNRSPLKNKAKLQVHGHTPLKGSAPAYDPASDSWNIDTAAVYGYGLSALIVSEAGIVQRVITVATDPRDISPPRQA